MRRTERLFALAEYLRGRRTGVTAEKLAERFGVTVRTIYRDLDSLRDASLPLHSERGRGGGYALDRSYSLPPVNFTVREAAILLTAGRWLTTLRLMPFTDALQTAMDKVRAALPTAAQRETDALMSALQFTGVPTPPVDPAVRSVLEQAWFARACVRIRYRGSDGLESVRVVRIERVVLEKHESILHCIDANTREQRPFRMQGVLSAHLVDRRA